ncbi:MAG: SLC13 family permease [Chthoniobacterales bacterium]|nr:SLC13 family permease [Chthoniobacterales bacterium]
MTWEIAVVLGLVAFALVQFVREKWPLDLTGLAVFAILLLLSQLPGGSAFPDAARLLKVFANPAPLTVAAMFVLTYALERTGAISRALVALESVGNLGPRGLLLLMMLAAGFVSAFINNTPVVVVGLPVAIHLAKRAGVPASIFLIPLSYAAVFGGCCTLVGTSTNLLGSGLLADAGQKPLGMFEIGAVGLPLAIIGTLYTVWAAPKLLPVRRMLAEDLGGEDGISEYAVEATVHPRSPVIGKTLAEAGFGPRTGMRIIEVLRRGEPVFDPLDTVRLEEGDHLVIAGAPKSVASILGMQGVNLKAESGKTGEFLAAHETHLAEAIVGPLSEIAGRSLRDINFRQRFGLVVLAVHRRGLNLSRGFESVPLQAGDTLLLMGSEPSLNQLRRSSDLLLLDRTRVPTSAQKASAPLVFTTLAAVIVVSAFEWLPIEVAAIAGCVLLMVAGAIKPREAYGSVDWPLMFLIYTTLALGVAMESTGAARYIAEGMVQTSAGWFSDAWKPVAMLAAIYLLTVIITEVLSNNATVVLMMPIALGIATQLGLDVRPFAVAIILGSSAGFATPIGYQTNTFVYSAGGYKFTDFLRIGLPLNLLYLVGAAILIPLVWPLHK